MSHSHITSKANLTISVIPPLTANETFTAFWVTYGTPIVILAGVVRCGKSKRIIISSRLVVFSFLVILNNINSSSHFAFALCLNTLQLHEIMLGTLVRPILIF